MQIDIYSDTICPWCYIGKKRLERALAEKPQPGITFRWRAFQLNPTMPNAGMNRLRYLELKFGGKEAAEQVYAPIREAGEEERIGPRELERREEPDRASRARERRRDR